MLTEKSLKCSLLLTDQSKRNDTLKIPRYSGNFSPANV